MGLPPSPTFSALPPSSVLCQFRMFGRLSVTEEWDDEQDAAESAQEKKTHRDSRYTRTFSLTCARVCLRARERRSTKKDFDVDADVDGKVSELVSNARGREIFSDVESLSHVKRRIILPALNTGVDIRRALSHVSIFFSHHANAFAAVLPQWPWLPILHLPIEKARMRRKGSKFERKRVTQYDILHIRPFCPNWFLPTGRNERFSQEHLISMHGLPANEAWFLG